MNEGSLPPLLPGKAYKVVKLGDGSSRVTVVPMSLSLSKKREWPFGTGREQGVDALSRFVAAETAGLQRPPKRLRGSTWKSALEMRQHMDAVDEYNKKKMAAVRAAKRNLLGGELFTTFIDANGEIHRMRNPAIGKEDLARMPSRWYTQKTIKLLFGDKNVSPAASLIIHALGPESANIFKKWWGESFGNLPGVKKEHVLLFIRELEDGQVDDKRSGSIKKILDKVRADAVEKNVLPKERVKRKPSDYEKMVKSYRQEIAEERKGARGVKNAAVAKKYKSFLSRGTVKEDIKNGLIALEQDAVNNEKALINQTVTPQAYTEEVERIRGERSVLVNQLANM